MMLFLLACTVGDSATKTVDDTTIPGEIPTVVATKHPAVFRVSWVTDAQAEVTLEYGVDGTFDHSMPTNSEDGLTHNALMAGLGAGETWSVRAVETVDGASVTSDAATIEVPLPTDPMPDVIVADGSDLDRDGFYLVACAGSGTDTGGTVSILDHAGRRTWWTVGGTVEMISDAWLVGETVWWMSFGEAEYLQRVDLDGENALQFNVENISHSFAPLPDGGVIAAVRDEREVDNTVVQGDQLVRYDRDGNSQGVLWSSWDAFPFDSGQLVDGESPYDWTHVNTVRFDGGSNTIVLTLLSFDAMVGVDLETGETRWVLGGDFSDIDMSAIDAEDMPLGLHGGIQTPTGVMFFNNRTEATDDGEYWSEAVEYAVDWDAKVATTAWTYDADQEVFNSAMGNAEDLTDGRRMVSFGIAGRVVELDIDQRTPVWQSDTPLGTANGYIHPLADVAGATR